MNRKGFTLIELMIVIAIIGILAAIAIPNFRKAREQAREKACYANMRVILGAIEMYNMDKTSMLKSMADAGDPTTSASALVSGKYLKSPVNKPEMSCGYGGTELDGTGLIFCDVHGTIEGAGN
ncbi:MAG TPA: prepilin-type N-terminal cleavage/methylation domain-containing protein [Candidatus Rifleibacterium sp.]|nr:prepilin-type N-terminal cleavage/methylation domain-containing protein [Candidatus Rifleibacterium sp.]HOI89486.1 prepilin-type N-terminal cleavage/methylation domain-containing protein [Candidatus Rifleibacterium sp.]